LTLATLSTRRSCQDGGVRRRIPAVIADLVAVLVFVLLGRRSHDEGPALAGTVATAWPFVAGAAVGELAAVRLPVRSLAAGAVVAAGAVAVGMPLRRLAGGGTPLSFVLVATTFLVLFLLGWRAVAAALDRRRVRAA
jgi:peptidoglycan/LPS O-acetylase OafA/YrhL